MNGEHDLTCGPAGGDSAEAASSGAGAQALSPERVLARFITRLQPEAVPDGARQVLTHVLMAVLGTGVAGAGEEGIAALRELLVDAGGRPEATTLVFGDRLPVRLAAQFNATLCRALDYCDAMAPGPHFGSALVPAALAVAELQGGCSGSEFLAALAAGAEVGARFNLSEAQYDGFDPTGIAVPFAAAAAAARLLQLSEVQTLHALALVFNRCGGSFQSHVDGSLGVRFTQGWVAEAGVQCAQLAQRGVTGPVNFLAGHYGYQHLYGRGTLDVAELVAGLGTPAQDWRLHRVVFKRFPSCGVTQGVTALTLDLLADGVRAEDVVTGEVRLPPYAHRLVGKPFALGSNPRVDAQFNAGYCVANALVRRSSQLAHFEPAAVADAALRPMIYRIRVVADAALDARGHTAVDLSLTLADGRTLRRQLDIAPGFPGAELTPEQHRARLADCLRYAPRPLGAEREAELLALLGRWHALDDVRALLPALLAA